MASALRLAGTHAATTAAPRLESDPTAADFVAVRAATNEESNRILAMEKAMREGEYPLPVAMRNDEISEQDLEVLHNAAKMATPSVISRLKRNRCRLPQMQPTPARCKVTYFDAGPVVVTTIGRIWRDGDSGPGGNCTRCHTCEATGNWCQMMVNREVPESEAVNYSPRQSAILDRHVF